jgi:DNA helicase-2/ATP-dependent DNA helicase PcrA
MLDLSTLNPPQREAVTHRDGPLLVLAGAGSGKTRVITYRIASLLAGGATPESVLAMTFTNKAADEMRGRVTGLVGAGGRRVLTSTFHSFGLWLLKEEATAADLPRRFGICDAADQLALVKRCMKEVQIDDRRFDARRVLWRISQAKNARTALRVADATDDYHLVAAEIMPRYQIALRGQQSVDFDDLIALPVQLLETHPQIRDRVRNRFRHLLVDEYQDTNRCQLELLKLLCSERPDLCAVGDDDQAIYGWRGAEVQNILRFDRHFPGAREVRLEQNYRSTGHVLSCANAVIQGNAAAGRKEKRLWTDAGSGEPVRVAPASTEEEEAELVAGEIARLRREGRRYGEMAVLYRLNAQSQPFEEALRAAGIPHAVHGGTAFFERAEVRDLLAYLKVCANPRDDVSLARIANVPTRGIGDASMARLVAHALERRIPLYAALAEADRISDLPPGAAEKMGAFRELISRHAARLGRGKDLSGAARALVDEVGLLGHVRASVASLEAGTRKVEGLEATLRSLEGFERREARPSLAVYLSRLALDSRDDDGDGGDGLALMTLHAAKGLEFPIVFLIGCEEDLLPCAGIQGQARDLAEERRLAYVGITRARERLYLTRAAARERRGKMIPRTPSRFLEELPKGAWMAWDPHAEPGAAESGRARSAAVLADLRARLAGTKS